MKTYKGVE